MQVAVSFNSVPIASPRATAPSTIAAPTIARIRAYSAAEAPDSSRRKVFTKVIILTPIHSPRPEEWKRILSKLASGIYFRFTRPRGGYLRSEPARPVNFLSGIAPELHAWFPSELHKCSAVNRRGSTQKQLEQINAVKHTLKPNFN